MKSRFPFSSVGVLISLATFLEISKSIDLVEECKSTADSHVTRGYFTCCSASPRGLPLLDSLNFEAGWERCAVEPESPNEDPVISAWRVYRCLVFSGLQGKPLRPTTFANLITSKYPVLIRGKLSAAMSLLEQEGSKFEVDVDCLRRTPYPKVHLVRNLFYDAEREICEENDSLRTRTTASDRGQHEKNEKQSNSHDFATNLCQTCDRSRELYHRNGDCCSQVPLPFPFSYLPIRYGNNARVQQCTEDLVDDVGLPSDTTFANRLKYLCYPSCEYYLSGILTEDELWAGVELFQSQSSLRSLVEKMMPTYFAPKYKEEIQAFVVENFQTAWAQTPTFESRIKLSQRDIRNCDKGKLKNLLASCKAHRLVETMTNLYLTEFCEDIYDDESVTSHNSGNSSSYPENQNVPESTVTLDFNWKSSGRRADDIIQNQIKNYFANKNQTLRNQTYIMSSSSRPAKSTFG